MAKRWLRGPQIVTPGTTQNGVDHVPVMMFWYLFLVELCGWTHVDEVVTGGPTRTFTNGFEANNTDGTLTNSDYTFTTISTPFVVGDIGKFLCILDTSNPENCGIYEIVGYTSSSVVTINFYAPGGTFPAAQGSLSWWMLDTNNASYTPVTFGDYFVVESPHSTYPFEMKVEYTLAGNYGGGRVEVSPNSGAWNAGSHVWNTGARVMTGWTIWDRYYSDVPQSRAYAMADEDGAFALFWNDRSAASFVQATMVALVDPLESSPARSANERLMIAGGGNGFSTTGENNEVDRGDDAGGLGIGQVWEDYSNRWRWVQMMALRDEASGVDYFSRNIGVNARTGERDALPFMYTISAEAADHRFAPHSKIPIAHISMGTAVAVGELTPFDSDDYYHLRDGSVIPWNGLPQA